MAELTMAEKVAYIKNGYSKCPFCKSEDISGRGHVEVDDQYCYQDCSCDECDEQWRDIYKLVDVEDVKT